MIYTLQCFKRFINFERVNNIEFQFFDKASDIATNFLQYLENLTKYTLVCGFNSSSGNKVDKDYNTIYGFDLNLITQKSPLYKNRLTPINGTFSVYNLFLGVTTNFLELPMVLFVDLLPLLV